MTSQKICRLKISKVESLDSMYSITMYDINNNITFSTKVSNDYSLHSLDKDIMSATTPDTVIFIDNDSMRTLQENFRPSVDAKFTNNTKRLFVHINKETLQFKSYSVSSVYELNTKFNDLENNTFTYISNETLLVNAILNNSPTELFYEIAKNKKYFWTICMVTQDNRTVTEHYTNYLTLTELLEVLIKDNRRYGSNINFQDNTETVIYPTNMEQYSVLVEPEFKLVELDMAKDEDSSYDELIKFIPIIDGEDIDEEFDCVADLETFFKQLVVNEPDIINSELNVITREVLEYSNQVEFNFELTGLKINTKYNS